MPELHAGDSIVSRPTSCRCGASEALFLRRADGAEESLGCPCHHTLTLRVVPEAAHQGLFFGTPWVAVDEHTSEWITAKARVRTIGHVIHKPVKLVASRYGPSVRLWHGLGSVAEGRLYPVGAEPLTLTDAGIATRAMAWADDTLARLGLEYAPPRTP